MEEILIEIGGCVDDSSKPLHSSISKGGVVTIIGQQGRLTVVIDWPFLLTELMKEDVDSDLIDVLFFSKSSFKIDST